MRSFLVISGVAVAMLVAVPASAATYIALGDSITFGETDLQYIPSGGNRGYVDDFADTIGMRTGERPNVINLAIDGETASSFFTGFGRTPPVVGRGDLPLALQNTNYSGPIPITQGNMFLQRAMEVTGSGDSISTISITLGFNELAALSLLPTAEGLAAINPTLDRYRIQYGEVLSQIRSVAPAADLFLLNYYNPFPADDNVTPNPASPIFAQGGPKLNAIIQDLASQYGAFYVDTATPFMGREAELTYIDEVGNGDRTPSPYSPFDMGLAPIGNVHPTEQSYAVIADQLAAASATAVPEPSTWAMLLVGFGFVGGTMRRLRRRQGALVEQA